MKKYKYSARNVDGQVLTGTISARDQFEVAEQLQQKGLVVVAVNEDLGLSLSKLNEINIGGVPMKDKVVFMRQLSTMISAGLPLTQALEILYKQATNPQFKRVLDQVTNEVKGGTSMAKSFRMFDDVFDEIVINLLEAGEESGHLEEILQRVATELENQKKLNERIKGAFTYPAVISVVIVAVVGIMMFFLVPAMEEIYSEFDAELPTITQWLINISNFMRAYWWLLAVMIASGIIGFKYYIETESGKKNWHLFKLKFPVLGTLSAKIQLTQFNRILALLLSSGLSIIESLNLTAGALSNVHFRDAVLTAREEVEKGVPMATPISRSEHFPLIVSQMIAVGEESGQIDHVLNKMAEYYADEVQVMTDNLTTLLEPLILIVVGVVIGFIALAVYMPMFTLVEVIG